MFLGAISERKVARNMDRKKGTDTLARSSIRLLRTSVLNDRLLLHAVGGGFVALFSWASLTVMFFSGSSATWTGFVFPVPSIGIAAFVVISLAKSKLSLTALFLAYAVVDAICVGLAVAVVMSFGGMPAAPPGM